MNKNSEIRILIIQTDDNLNSVLEKHLRKLAYKSIFITKNYTEAAQICSEYDISLSLINKDLLRTDDGIETAIKLRELYDMALILISDDKCILESSDIILQAEPDGFLILPYSLNNLKIRIQIALKRKKREDELKLKVRALDSIYNGVAIGEANKEGYPLIYVNKAYQKLTGYSYKEVEGQSAKILRKDDFDPESAKKISKSLSERIECREIIKNYRKNGTPFWNDLHLSPVKDKKGKVTHFIGVQHDITRQFETERLIRILVKAGSDIGINFLKNFLLELSVKLKVKYCFVAKALDKNPETAETVIFITRGHIRDNFIYKLKGTPCEKVMGKEIQIFDNNLQQAFPKDTDLVRMGVCSYLGVPLYSQSGKPLGLVAVLNDKPFDDTILLKEITTIFADRVAVELERIEIHENLIKLNQELENRVNERTEDLRKANNALEETLKLADSANKAKSNFISNMSHELRTPLNSVLGYSDILSGIIKDNEALRYIEAIKISGNSLMSLISDILDLSKIEAGIIDLNYTNLSLQKLFIEIETIFWIASSENNIDLIFEIDEKIPKYFVFDEIRLRQILVNIVGNAIKFTHKGFVKITAEAENISDNNFDLIISISDSGIGIPEKFISKIFEAFSQHEEHDKRKYGGTGLGLAICKKFTEKLNGEIFVESKIGEGTTFKFIFKEVSTVGIEMQETYKNINQIEIPVKEKLFQKSINDTININKKNVRILIEHLENKLFPLWEEFQQRKPIDEVTSFGKECYNTGKKHKCLQLMKYGEMLTDATEKYDVARIEILTEKFPEIITEIKKYNIETL